MNEIKEFRDNVMTALANTNPEIAFTPCEKTQVNGETLYGIYAKPQGVSIAPIVYVNDLYKDGASKGGAANEVWNILKRHATTAYPEELINTITNKDLLLKKVEARVVSLEDNEDFLSNLIYVPYLDLAVYFVVSADIDDGKHKGSIRITKDVAAKCGIIDGNELFEAAKRACLFNLYLWKIY